LLSILKILLRIFRIFNTEYSIGYSSLTEFLTEMGHYTEAIKKNILNYLTILASSQKKAKAISKKLLFPFIGATCKVETVRF
jgi:uncharacterized protein Smg (DUF494 family)